jgi:hypothetical protein
MYLYFLDSDRIKSQAVKRPRIENSENAAFWPLFHTDICIYIDSGWINNTFPVVQIKWRRPSSLQLLNLPLPIKTTFTSLRRMRIGTRTTNKGGGGKSWLYICISILFSPASSGKASNAGQSPPPLHLPPLPLFSPALFTLPTLWRQEYQNHLTHILRKWFLLLLVILFKSQFSNFIIHCKPDVPDLTQDVLICFKCILKVQCHEMVDDIRP